MARKSCANASKHPAANQWDDVINRAEGSCNQIAGQGAGAVACVRESFLQKHVHDFESGRFSFPRCVAIQIERHGVVQGAPHLCFVAFGKDEGVD